MSKNSMNEEIETAPTGGQGSARPARVVKIDGAICGQIVDVIKTISHWDATVVRDELLEQTNIDPDDKYEWCGIYIEDWKPWMNEHEDDGGFADFNTIFLSQDMVNKNDAIVLVPYRDEIQLIKNMMKEFEKIVKRVESFLESHYATENYVQSCCDHRCLERLQYAIRYNETLREAMKYGHISYEDLFKILHQSGEFDDVESQLYNAIQAIPNY